MSLAQKWFDRFFAKFVEIRKENPHFGFGLSKDQWTQQMKDFLKNLGKERGFEVEAEGHGRFDQYWKRNDQTIAIEHEIDQKSIFESELRKLADVTADLKVLITYVRDYNFPSEPYAICKKIKKELDKNIRQFKEFLLLIGTKSPKIGERNFMERETDWFARRFFVGATRMDILSPSRTLRAKKAWETRKKKS